MPTIFVEMSEDQLNEYRKECVRRGVKWLNEHAPLGWERRMFDIHRGRASLRANITTSREHPVALAFEYVEHLVAGEYGHVTCHSVFEHFDLSHEKQIELGFTASTNQFDIGENRRLNKCWYEALTTYAQPESAPYKHRPAQLGRTRKPVERAAPQHILDELTLRHVRALLGVGRRWAATRVINQFLRHPKTHLS
jgi:hypothetical protein